MISIALALFGGWILALFGFDSLVISGMFEIFGKEITVTGYYFIFAILGALRSVLIYIGSSSNSNNKGSDEL